MAQYLLKNFYQKDSSFRVPRFLLIGSCYKIFNSQTSFTLCYGVGVGIGSRRHNRKF